MQAVGASRRVFELLDREPKQPPAGEATPKGSQGGGEVIFENVWCACHTLHMASRNRHDAGAAMQQLLGCPATTAFSVLVRSGPQALALAPT